jgi:hypothetical protein
LGKLHGFTRDDTHQDLDWARIETWGDGEGVTAAFYRANACSDEKLRPYFNWPVLRAIRGYKRARTGSNWEITNPKSTDHGGVPRDRVKNREKRGFMGSSVKLSRLLDR